MNLLLILTAIFALAVATVLLIVQSSGKAVKNFELEADFVVGSIDQVCENFKVGSKVEVSGILGSDFLEKYRYTIDFGNYRIWHNYYYISFKEAMELLRIPFIVLWQDDRKYIFIIDTGSTNCHISTKALDTLDFELDSGRNMTTSGVGDSVSTKGMATAKFKYK